ncbi:unnamed protein product [Auanema sp. JU1783]|nr:unnamed protein product [Auanema sp. JU1783]
MRANSDQTFVEVKVEISNIRATGLHQFERKVFENPISNEDVVLNVNGEKLHCHSQILSWNSKVFKAVIQKSRASCEIFLEEGIPVEDLRELLHYIYFPLEAVDEHNFRQLLHWGKKFEVNHIVQLCQQFMESVLRNPITTEEGKLEIFLLSWKYFVEPLKVVSGEVVFPSKPPDLMSTLSKCEIYQSTKETEKLEMWNFLFGKLYSY